MPDFDQFEGFIFEKMSETHLPGLSVAIIDSGEVIYGRGFGLRDLKYGLRTTAHTLYGIGSVTKSFTALSIMQLSEKGRLSLDDPVAKFVPLDLKSKEEPVKIWHLLSHSSGIPALAYAEAFIRYRTGADDKWIPVATHEDLFTFMKDANEWSLTRPGERWFYLNEGYLILGYIIEKLSGIRYEKYVKKNILEPLQMDRSCFAREMVEASSDVATPYVITRDGECKESTYAYGPVSSDGGLISNVLDLTKYLNMYLNRGKHNEQILASPEVIVEMETPRAKLPLQVFDGESYGYGLHIIPDFLGSKLIGHGGSVLVATAYMGYIPEKRVAIALLANGSGYPLSQMGLYGLASILGKNPENLPFIKLERVFDLLSGLYETYKGTMKAQVVLNGGLLSLEVKDRYTDMIVPLIPDDIDDEVKTFHTVQCGAKLPVEFIIKGKKEIDLIYERYRLKKVGKLK